MVGLHSYILSVLWAQKIQSSRCSLGGNPACEHEFINSTDSKLLHENRNGLGQNSTVSDNPFVGSGTTLMVARQLGRSAIGIEISEEYAKLIKQRLNWGFDPNIEWKVD